MIMQFSLDLIIALLFYGFTVCIQLCITYRLVRNLYGTLSTKINPSIKKSALSFAFASCIRLILLLIHYLTKSINDNETASLTEVPEETFELILSDWAGMASDIFLFATKLLLYWYLITRLKISFYNSHYYPSKYIFYTLTFFMIIIFKLV